MKLKNIKKIVLVLIIIFILTENIIYGRNINPNKFEPIVDGFYDKIHFIHIGYDISILFIYIIISNITNLKNNFSKRRKKEHKDTKMEKCLKFICLFILSILCIVYIIESEDRPILLSFVIILFLVLLQSLHGLVNLNKKKKTIILEKKKIIFSVFISVLLLALTFIIPIGDKERYSVAFSKLNNSFVYFYLDTILVSLLFFSIRDRIMSLLFRDKKEEVKTKKINKSDLIAILSLILLIAIQLIDIQSLIDITRNSNHNYINIYNITLLH